MTFFMQLAKNLSGKLFCMQTGLLFVSKYRRWYFRIAGLLASNKKTNIQLADM